MIWPSDLGRPKTEHVAQKPEEIKRVGGEEQRLFEAVPARRSKHGPAPVPRRPLAERFFSHVDKAGPVAPGAPSRCWLWVGAVNNRGYGTIQMGSRVGGYRGPMQAHRLSWEIAFGYIPDGLVVRHAVCGNPRCVRPDHLRLGTQAQNCADTVRMGRSLKGEKNHQHRLTTRDVIDILDRLRDGEAPASVATSKNVTTSTVYQISDGRAWSWFTGRKYTRKRSANDNPRPAPALPQTSEATR
jgi:hypothetical protein